MLEHVCRVALRACRVRSLTCVLVFPLQAQCNTSDCVHVRGTATMRHCVAVWSIKIKSGSHNYINPGISTDECTSGDFKTKGHWSVYNGTLLVRSHALLSTRTSWPRACWDHSQVH